MYNYSALQQYQSVDVQSRVSSASPHGLVLMLLDGVLKKLALASGAIARREVAERGNQISGALRIIDSLRASLDYQRGGEVASNLGSLYDYMERRLLQANREADNAIIKEVHFLVEQIKMGWDAIREGQGTD